MSARYHANRAARYIQREPGPDDTAWPALDVPQGFYLGPNTTATLTGEVGKLLAEAERKGAESARTQLAREPAGTGRAACQDLLTTIAERAVEGIYEHGNYAARGDLETSELIETETGSVYFYVYTRTPGTDRERVKVTVSRS